MYRSELAQANSGTMPLELVRKKSWKQTLWRWRNRHSLGLFWRTFFLLAMLLLGSLLAWLLTLRTLEFEPRAVQTAQEIASLVNLSRAALIHSDAISRVSLIKTMKEQEAVRIFPREPGDTWDPLDDDALGVRISQEVINRLGPGTLVANSVNNEDGLWVGFAIDSDYYWMKTDKARFNRTANRTWLIWLMAAAALSLTGAAVIARLINQPLKQLSHAVARVRDGDLSNNMLDENVATREARAVNIGFNRMTAQLAKVEQDRTVMLAGISHDLRTPLARMRLETELSIQDDEARKHMVSDIEQLDAVIDKFLDYARPSKVVALPTNLREVIMNCIEDTQKRSDLYFHLDLDDTLWVMADPVEAGRIVSNLLENAYRYGRSADTGLVEVDIIAKRGIEDVRLRIRDHGAGVPAHQLPYLTKPFFRGEVARTAANGAGLGLSIVEMTVARMGGSLTLSNSSTGGLVAQLKFKRAPAAS